MLKIHVLASGSDGNCFIVSFNGRSIIVDAGLTCKKIKKFMEIIGIEEKMVEGILLTHEHRDHVLGAEVLSKKLGVAIYCNEKTLINSKIEPFIYKKIESLKEFKIGDFTIYPALTSHHVAESNAFFLKVGGKKIFIITDTGIISSENKKLLEDADLIIIEANYDLEMLEKGEYPIYLKKIISSEVGHLSNVGCGLALKNIKKNCKIFLAHISKNNNTCEIAKKTVSKIIERDIEEINCMEDNVPRTIILC